MTLAQLTLDLPHRAALGAQDFLVSECNLAAVRLIDAWPHWQDQVQLLIGPASSGKTHLARVWQALSGAEALDPGHLGSHSLDAMTTGVPLVVEDVDRRAYDEKALFHLLNLARENRLFVLLTAQSAPSRWGIELPDLKSRLNAVPTVEIGEPDEALRLKADDPAVRAGVFELVAMPWMLPAGAMHFTPTTFPRSTDDV